MADGGVSLVAKMRGAEQRVAIGQGKWIKGSFAFAAEKPVPVAVSGAWTADDTYTVQLCQYRAPFITTLRLRFAGDEVTLEHEQNLGFGPNKPVALTGKAQ